MKIAINCNVEKYAKHKVPAVTYKYKYFSCILNWCIQMPKNMPMPNRYLAAQGEFPDKVANHALYLLNLPCTLLNSAVTPDSQRALYFAEPMCVITRSISSRGAEKRLNFSQYLSEIC